MLPTVTAQRRAGRRTYPAPIDETADLVHLQLVPPSEAPVESRPRLTWLHAVIAAVTLLLLAWVAFDLATTSNPDVRRGHLRALFAISTVTLVVAGGFAWNAWRAARLHTDTRAVVNHWAERIQIHDQRYAEIHACMAELVQGQRTLREWQRVVVEDVALIGQAAADLRRSVPEGLGGLARANASLTTIGKQVVGIGGGQAILHGTVEHLAAQLAQLAQLAQRQPGVGTDLEEVPDAEAWRHYLRGIADAKNADPDGR